MTTIISKKEYKRRENIRVKKAYQEKLKSEGKVSEKEKLSQRRAKNKNPPAQLVVLHFRA